MSQLNADMSGLTGSTSVAGVAPLSFDPMDEKFGALPAGLGKAPAAPQRTPAKREAAEETVELEEQDEEASRPGNFNKALQREQRERSKLASELAEIKQLLKASAQSPATPAAKGRLDKILDLLGGDKGKQMDEILPGHTELLRELVEEVREGRATPAQADAAVKEQLEQIKFDAFFARYPEDHREAFVEEQQRVNEEEGLSGERLEGYMAAWWKNYLASQKSEEDVPPVTRTKNAGSRGIIPVTTAPRAPRRPNPTQVLQSGRGGNIGGIPFRKGGGR